MLFAQFLADETVNVVGMGDEMLPVAARCLRATKGTSGSAQRDGRERRQVPDQVEGVAEQVQHVGAAGPPAQPPAGDRRL